ncbi:MAG TPA: hypothetical protein VMT59_04690 [Gaiellaceae bacterium]|nr:hypothetical protein [Gaiellaceae bacterium]
MATKKQQRRRQKERRHEYEEVWVDAEGKELAPEEVEQVVPEAAAKATASPKKSAPSRGRSGRVPPPPSWRRVGKRAAIFAPLMFVTVYIIGGAKLTLAGKLFQTAVLLLFFIPFSYAMDSIQYRNYQKRQGQPPKQKQKPE